MVDSREDEFLTIQQKLVLSDSILSGLLKNSAIKALDAQQLKWHRDAIQKVTFCYDLFIELNSLSFCSALHFFI